MPCSGEKSATSFTPGALWNRSIVLSPSRSRPVWFVIRPTRLSLSSAKPSRLRTSMPLWEWEGEKGGQGDKEKGGQGDEEFPSPCPLVPTPHSPLPTPSMIEAATTDATRPRSELTSAGCFGSSFGWTRLLRKTTKVSLDGSIHNPVPVNPVWPKLPTGNRSPRLAEYPVKMSQPMPRAAPSTAFPPVGRASVIRATPIGLNTLAP